MLVKLKNLILYDLKCLLILFLISCIGSLLMKLDLIRTLNLLSLVIM